MQLQLRAPLSPKLVDIMQNTGPSPSVLTLTIELIRNSFRPHTYILVMSKPDVNNKIMTDIIMCLQLNSVYSITGYRLITCTCN